MLEQSVVSTVVVPPAAAERPHHLRDGARLVRLLLRHRKHKVLFATAVGGAVLFAACTVVSSLVIGAIIDHIIRPRFVDGHVDASTVVGLLGLLILVGVVRAAGVIVRRTWAGRTNWAVTESLTAEVIDRAEDAGGLLGRHCRDCGAVVKPASAEATAAKPAEVYGRH